VLRGREARKTVLNIQMGRGKKPDTDPDYPGAIDLAYSEEAARGFYAHWQKLMLDVDGAATREIYAHAAE
jgi:hypothetical protein